MSRRPPGIEIEIDQGRAQALREAVEAHRGRLLSMIGKRIRDQVEAEDVLQEVFEEYVEAYDLGQAIETLGAWLVRVAKNKIVDRFRRRRTQREHREAVLAAEDGAANGNSSSDGLSQGPEDDWTRAWLRAEIVEAIAELPDEQREVFVKHELEGKSFEQIAAETGVGVNTLLSRKRYAVLFLRDHLKEVYDELE